MPISNTLRQVRGDSIVYVSPTSFTANGILYSFSELTDTGAALAGGGFYYIYHTFDTGVSKIKVSFSNIRPFNSTSYKKIGAFYNNYSAQIHKIYQYGDNNYVTFMAYIRTDNGGYYQTPSGFISSIGNSAGSINVNYIGGWTIDVPVPICNTAQAIAAGQDGVARIQGFSLGGLSMYTGIQHSGSDDGAVSSSSLDTTIVVSKSGVDAIQPDWKNY